LRSAQYRLTLTGATRSSATPLQHDEYSYQQWRVYRLFLNYHLKMAIISSHSAAIMLLMGQQQSCPTRHVQWHLPTIATGRTFCGGCLNEVDRVIHQSMCSLPYSVACPQRPPPDGDRFFQTLKHQARECAKRCFCTLRDCIFAPTDAIATVL
jgi:hypothetical protein